MNIKEFAEKYNVQNYEIDYWTKLDLLHPEVNEKNGYRIYTEKNEEEIKKILIAKAMGVTTLKDYVIMFDYLPKAEWDKFVFERINQEMERVSKSYKDALKYAKEFVEA